MNDMKNIEVSARQSESVTVAVENSYLHIYVLYMLSCIIDIANFFCSSNKRVVTINLLALLLVLNRKIVCTPG